MEPEVTAAVVSGTIGVLTTIGGFAIREYLGNRPMETVLADRRHALSGKWEGMFSQELGHQQVTGTFATIFEFTVKRTRVMAVADYKRQGLVRLTMSGRFLNSRYILVTYRNSDPRIVQFGTMYLVANDRFNEITGRFLGHGNVSEQLVTGTIRLHRAT